MMIRPIPGLTLDAQPEGIILRMLCWGEARGESPLGKLAVLWVVHNRAMKTDSTLKAEALRPLQFSCFNANDPNRGKMLKAWEDDPVGWAVCDAVASLYEARQTTDPTDQATHYYVAKMKNPPAWGRGHAGWQETVEIQSHVFGRAA